MKKIILYFLSIILILFIIVKIATIMGKSVFNNSVNVKINEEKSFDVDKIKQINIDSNDTKIRVYPNNESNVKIGFKGYINGKNEKVKPKLITKFENGNLIIKIEKVPGIQLHYENNTSLDISMPEVYKGDVCLNTNYGNINVEKLNVSNLRFKSNTGDINFREVEAKNIIGDTSYGKISFSDLVGNTNIFSKRGNIFLQYKKVADNVKVETTSSKVKIIFPQDSAIRLKAKTKSGGIENDFFVNRSRFIKNQLDEINGNGKNMIDIGTDSGDIVISK